jgi:hypothetical protein
MLIPSFIHIFHDGSYHVISFMVHTVDSLFLAVFIEFQDIWVRLDLLSSKLIKKNKNKKVKVCVQTLTFESRELPCAVSD